MSIWILVLLCTALVVATLLPMKRYFGSYLRYRGPMVVSCPETRQQVAVEVDARRAAMRSARGRDALRLTACTRWPQRRSCGQGCLSQIESSPEDCMVRQKLTAWYKGKHCTCCETRFQEIRWYDHKPALMSPGYRLVQWKEIPLENLSEVLSTHKPVCWNCNLAERW